MGAFILPITVMTPLLDLFGRGMIRLIRVYQSTAPWRPPACRFTPTCSEYAAQAIAKYGPLHGLWRGIKRVGRCHPFHPGGDDPVQ